MPWLPRLATAQLFMFTAANGYMNHYFPAHYFKDLHIDYNEDANKKAKEEGLEEWWQLFNQTREKTRPYIHYPGPPYLFAWVPTSVTMDRTVWDRNPYYWKVDEAGNQLPYLDNIYGVLVVESELVKARGIAGEFDFLVEGFGMDEAPLLEQNAERYNYNVIIGPNTLGRRRLLLPEPEPQRPGQAGAVPRQALPAGSVPRHQPRRDQRHRIPGAGHAAARLRPRRRAVLR